MVSLRRNATRYVSKLSNKIRRKLDRLSSREAFSGSQGRVLQFLLAQNEDIFQKDIEEEYSIRPSTATQLLNQMEQNGLICRVPVPYDRRLKKIQLTDKAQQYRQQVVKDLTELEKTVTAGISPEDLEVFFRVVETMMDNLS